MAAEIIYGTVFYGSGAILMDRIYGNAGTLATQATVSTITCTVNDLTTGVAVSVITPTVTVASTIFDTLQTDAVWTKDATGYNFKHAMPATAFPTAGHVYFVTYTFTPTSGAVYKSEFQITAR